jgi:hypothetical protein
MLYKVQSGEASIRLHTAWIKASNKVGALHQLGPPPTKGFTS